MRVGWQAPPQPMSQTQTEILKRLYETIALVKQGRVKASSNKACAVWRLCENWCDDEPMPEGDEDA